MLKKWMRHLRIQDKPGPAINYKGKKNDYFASLTKTFMGRDALSLLLYNLNKKSVLLPAYICQEVIDEFKKNHYTIHYYDLNDDFFCDAELLAEKIDKLGVDLFYFVIYFGFNSINRQLVTYLRERFPHLFIVEDRAHYLSNVYNLRDCNAYIYSLRKLLPILDGGGIVTPIDLNFSYESRMFTNILPYLMLGKKLIFGHKPYLTRAQVAGNKPSAKVKPASAWSSRIIDTYDYPAEIIFRKKQYNRWLEKLEGTGFIPLFKEVAYDDIPQGCPIFVSDAMDFQRFMYNYGFYLKNHWPLGDFFKDIAPVSHRLSKVLITLPVYRGLMDEDMDDIISAMSNYKRN